MPIYTLQGPDGRTYQIEGPAGATAERLAAVVQGQGRPSAREQIDNDPISRAARDPAAEMGTMQRFAAGYGGAGVNLLRGIGQMAGMVDRNDVAEARKRDASLMNTGAGAAGNFLGTAAALAPTAFIPGANTAAGGAAIGAISGLVAPSTSTQETLTNTGIGGVAGLTVPLLMTAGKTAKSFIEPLYEKGREKIVGRAISDAAATDPAQLAQALRGNASQVPGVQRTVAEVADNPSLAALQRTATQTSPAVMNEAAGRQAANSQARTAALQGLAPDRQAAKTAREGATKALYQQADALPVALDGAALPQGGTQLAELMKRPSMQQAVRRAQQLAAEAGETFDPASLTGRGAHYLKMALDDMANASPATGIGGNELRAVQGTLREYLGNVEQQLPSYGQARSTYAQMSRPLNQADVIEEIGAKGANFRGDLTPAAYARALRDETAQRATGQANATLAGTMEPGQLSTLNAIKDDLMRQDFAQTAGRGVGSDTVQKLAYSNMLNAAGVPSAVRNFGPAGIVGNVAQRAGQVVYKDANEKLAERLARALLDPKDAAALVESGMVTPQMAALANALRRTGTVGGASAPALVQANQ